MQTGRSSDMELRKAPAGDDKPAMQVGLFDKDLSAEPERHFKFCSPEKQEHSVSPFKEPRRMADPLFKPFADGESSCEHSSGNSLYSDSCSFNASVKSEDASPLRRRMLRSPTKKRKLANDKRKQQKLKEKLIEDMLAESTMVDE